VDGRECPALYFDPLIVIGGDREVNDPREPNYSTRCDEHHYLPGKEYTFLTLKPLGEQASRGDLAPLAQELERIRGSIGTSALYAHFSREYGEIMMNSLRVSCIAEKALLFLYAEQNLVANDQFIRLVRDLGLDIDYLRRRLSDCRRAAVLEGL
jgi:thymidine kinase